MTPRGRRTLVDALQAAVVATMPAVAMAAGEQMVTRFGTSIGAVPVAAWGLTLVLSTLAGVVALLNRIRDELRVNGSLRWPLLFVTSHMTGSWLAGLLIFFLGVGQNFSEAVMAGCIILGSFGGAVTIERLADLYLRQRLGIDTRRPTGPVPLDGPIGREFSSTQTMPPAVDRRGENRPVPIDRRRRPTPQRPPPRPSASDFTPLGE